MDILRIIKNSSPDECREMGELILDLGTKPRTAAWHANIDAAMALHASPAERTLVETLEKARERVAALNDGLLADGMNHEKLIAEELGRRGDSRTVSAYIADVCGGSAVSDVVTSPR